MKRKLIIALVVSLVSCQAYSQCIDCAWAIGDYPVDTINRFVVNLNFTSGIMQIDSVSQIRHVLEANASIADSSGNILFCSNGCFAMNIQSNLMLNGDNLNPSQCTADNCIGGALRLIQGNLILPNSGNPSQYFLFHQNCDYSNDNHPTKLYTSIIDFSLDSGRGGLVNKNNVLLSANLEISFLTATKHANGRDWWIVQHERNSDIYDLFLLTPQGISGPLVQHVGPVFSNLTDGWGTTKFTPDGNLLICGSIHHTIQILNFDRCSGLFHFDTSFYYPDSVQFIEISASSRFLYVMSEYRIYQYDLSASDISASVQLVATYDNYSVPPFPQFYTLFEIPQLAIDNKIYISCLSGCNAITTIDQPDSPGVACNVLQHNYILPCTNRGYPYFPNYRLRPVSGSVCDTVLSSSLLANLSNDLIIVPNPSPGHFHLQFKNSSEEIVTLYVMDITGRSIFQEPNHSNDLDLSSYGKGIYFLRAVSKRNLVFVKKLVVY